MLTLAPQGQIRIAMAMIDEHAAWMIVVAAEKLASAQDDLARSSRFAKVAQRLRAASRSRWHDPGAIRAASPVLDGPDGDPITLVEIIARFYDDSRAGIREAESCLLTRGWWIGAE